MREHVHEVAQQIAQSAQHTIVNWQDDSTGHREVGETPVFNWKRKASACRYMSSRPK
jgi:hypothetical protein